VLLGIKNQLGNEFIAPMQMNEQEYDEICDENQVLRNEIDEQRKDHVCGPLCHCHRCLPAFFTCLQVRFLDKMKRLLEATKETEERVQVFQAATLASPHPPPLNHRNSKPVLFLVLRK
jgi:hypothetical protein